MSTGDDEDASTSIDESQEPGEPAERPDLLAGIAGVVTLACGCGWMAFLAWMAIRPETPHKWMLALLAVLGVPCFSFGRQWLLEGLGRRRRVGVRWRRVVGGLVMTVYGCAFVIDAARHSGDGASEFAHAALAASLLPFGLLLIAGGAMLGVRLVAPDYLLRQLMVLVAISTIGSTFALAAYWADGIPFPREARLVVLLDVGAMILWARAAPS